MLYRFLLAFTLCVFISAGTARADFTAGKEAFDQKNWSAAAQFLLPLAQEGDAGALLLFGKMYADGLGVPQDPGKAFDLFLRSAQKGNAEAMVSVAALYSGGQGVEANKKAALEWFRKAAEQDHSVAQFVLGMALAAGDEKIGLQSNLIEAYKWLSLAGQDTDLPLRMRSTANKLAKHVYDKQMEIKNRSKADEALSSWKTKKWEDIAHTHVHWNTDTGQNVTTATDEQTTPSPQEPEVMPDDTQGETLPDGDKE
ncbi:MAG: sel1 repeat family protein [Alphaproteobacteria bacterium]|nr:MAG: sel1 repeat family protein [Alphaproteobacteria bacterium]